jgi:hypothetical protein
MDLKPAGGEAESIKSRSPWMLGDGILSVAQQSDAHFRARFGVPDDCPTAHDVVVRSGRKRHLMIATPPHTDVSSSGEMEEIQTRPRLSYLMGAGTYKKRGLRDRGVIVPATTVVYEDEFRGALPVPGGNDISKALNRIWTTAVIGMQRPANPLQAPEDVLVAADPEAAHRIPGVRRSDRNFFIRDIVFVPEVRQALF